MISIYWAKHKYSLKINTAALLRINKVGCVVANIIKIKHRHVSSPE
jgi:hypothetical protein